MRTETEAVTETNRGRLLPPPLPLNCSTQCTDVHGYQGLEASDRPPLICDAVFVVVDIVSAMPYSNKSQDHKTIQHWWCICIVNGRCSKYLCFFSFSPSATKRMGWVLYTVNKVRKSQGDPFLWENSRSRRNLNTISFASPSFGTVRPVPAFQPWAQSEFRGTRTRDVCGLKLGNYGRLLGPAMDSNSMFFYSVATLSCKGN